MASAKEVRAIIRAARRQGWRVQRSGSGHYKAYSPDGKTIVTLPSTPSGSLKPYVSHMRAGGFVWPAR